MEMVTEDYITALGLFIFIILFSFGMKMIFELLFKGFKPEIINHFQKLDQSVIRIRKVTKKDKNPFNSAIRSIRPFSLGARTVYRYRIIETEDKKGRRKKYTLQVTIKYLRKPRLDYR